MRRLFWLLYALLSLYRGGPGRCNFSYLYSAPQDVVFADRRVWADTDPVGTIRARFMQDPVYGLPRTHALGIPVNKEVVGPTRAYLARVTQPLSLPGFRFAYWAFCWNRTLWTTNAESRTTIVALGIAHENSSAAIERLARQVAALAPAPNTMHETCAMSW